ncbi:hypothetical protein VM1G_04744 [Cytospora mali]|uniref:Uncharacterized protein n=1 Tax=Cytospora mali TaxID=578113 RepID=A0A194W0L6_CYTMA|nr:hypothetical protein VM1G_04744 [Valsa mali]
MPEPDPHLPSRDLCAFELWARVVEMYSKMHLTKAKDKLIALAGIAEFMSTQVLGTETSPLMYVAGLWNKYLESQLLWRVEPEFRLKDRTFFHLSERPQDPPSSGRYIYRAPSFSWASVDAQKGSGIVYGEVTDSDLLIELYKGENPVVIENEESKSEFGLVAGGQVMIWGRLRRIKLYKDNDRFYWRLVDRTLKLGDKVVPLGKETHRNVYLDSPEDDEKRYKIFGSKDIYCVPAAYGERTEAQGSKYMICLLLQLAENDKGLPKHWKKAERRGTFRRIGLTKLSTWADKTAYDHILEKLESDVNGLPYRPHKYRPETGHHLIRVI